jgi:hypothetical protein
MVGACVASMMEEMKWNTQDNGIFIGHSISLVKGYVKKYMTRFRINGRTIKRCKLVCILVI